jgi:hypothetical protein
MHARLDRNYRKLFFSQPDSGKLLSTFYQLACTCREIEEGGNKWEKKKGEDVSLLLLRSGAIANIAVC